MRVLAIDPGPELSGVVVVNSFDLNVFFAGDVSTAELLKAMTGECCFDYIITSEGPNGTVMDFDVLVVEDITFMGFEKVGKSVFDTAKVIGDFRTAWRIKHNDMMSVVHLKIGVNYAVLMPRQDVKNYLCDGGHFRDPDTGRLKAITDLVVKKALIAKFPATGGGKTPEIGTKPKPGPLFIMKGTKHAWSALALAVTHIETIGIS